MEIDKIKKYLEKDDDDDKLASTIDELPPRFFESLVMAGVHVDLIEPSRIICSLKVPSRLLNVSKSLHGGAIAALVDCIGSAAIQTMGVHTTGVSVEINVSYLDAAFLHEDIEIESKVLRLGRNIAVATVELRKKSNGKIIAQGRHTKYLAVPSKL